MFQAQFRCPSCRAVISQNDVNVATDLALCRSCGKTSSFATVTSSSEISEDLLAKPPRWVNIHKDFANGITISYRKFPLALLFFIPFVAIWFGHSFPAIHSAFTRGKFDLSLLKPSIIVGAGLLLVIIIISLAGNWRIKMRNGTGSVLLGVGIFGWKRSFTYNRDTQVALRMTDVQVNGVRQKGILIHNDGKDLVFGTTMKEEAKQFIAAAIMRAVAEI